jgi:hypothetical protein
MTKEIIDLIHARMDACLELAQKDEDAAYAIAEARCLAFAFENGWDWEADDHLVRYCSKATTVECCIATRQAFDRFLAETANGTAFWPPALDFAVQKNLPPGCGYLLLAVEREGEEPKGICVTNSTREEQLALVQSWQKAQA